MWEVNSSHYNNNGTVFAHPDVVVLVMITCIIFYLTGHLKVLTKNRKVSFHLNCYEVTIFTIRVCVFKKSSINSLRFLEHNFIDLVINGLNP